MKAIFYIRNYPRHSRIRWFLSAPPLRHLYKVSWVTNAAIWARKTFFEVLF